MTRLGGPAPDLVYKNADGETRHLAALWSEGPALVLWLRHFG
jgi:hypothetical protein